MWMAEGHCTAAAVVQGGGDVDAAGVMLTRACGGSGEVGGEGDAVSMPKMEETHCAVGEGGVVLTPKIEGIHSPLELGPGWLGEAGGEGGAVLTPKVEGIHSPLGLGSGWLGDAGVTVSMPHVGEDGVDGEIRGGS
jgi:hypothetical protein